MYLHDAMRKLLIQCGRPMTTQEIADTLNQNGWYKKQKESLLTANQISARVNKHRDWFQMNNAIITLKDAIEDTHIERINHPDYMTRVDSFNQSTQNSPLMDCSMVETFFMDSSNYKPVYTVLDILLSTTGIYSIRINDDTKLPNIYRDALRRKEHNILYIGMTTSSLKERLGRQELQAKGHGTLFRSIGAILGYKPPIGSTKLLSNKNNYTFSESDKQEIIDWITHNLEICWIELDYNIHEVEKCLIRKYTPLLNIQNNPDSLHELEEARNECKKIAMT